MNSDFKELLADLCRFQVKFLVVGGYAVMHHTEPRFTKDLDLWIEPNLENAERLREALVRFGAWLDHMKVEDFCEEGVMFQIGIPPVRVSSLRGAGTGETSPRLAIRRSRCWALPTSSSRRSAPDAGRTNWILKSCAGGRRKDKSKPIGRIKWDGYFDTSRACSACLSMLRWPMMREGSRAVRLIGTPLRRAGLAGSIEIPHLSLLLVGEDLAALHVGIRRIGKRAVVETGKRGPDGGVPWLGGGHPNRGSDSGHVEDLAGRLERDPHATHGRWIRFHESPVHAVGGAVEGHPVGHRVSSARVALAPPVAGLRVDLEVAFWGGIGARSDTDRGGEEDLIPFRDIEVARAGTDVDRHGRGIAWLLGRGIKREGGA